MTYIRKCVSTGCKNEIANETFSRCQPCLDKLRSNYKEKRMSAPVQSLIKDDYALSVGDINITSQGSKIVLTKREGQANIKVIELDIEQALAVGIAIRSVATCVKYSKGE